jgi:hypothetical protein
VENLSRDMEAARLMTRLPEHRATPYDALPPSKVLPWILKAVASGRFGVIPEFLAFGRRARAYAREMKVRKRLLARAQAA